jgi:hypothetical protein
VGKEEASSFSGQSSTYRGGVAMKIGEPKTVTTDTVLVNFAKDEYSPFSLLGNYTMLYATLTRRCMNGEYSYGWEAVCQNGSSRMTVREHDYSTRDVDFFPLREAFAKLGWEYPENPHRGKEGWY